MNPSTRLMVEKLTGLAERGMTYSEAAAETGMTYHSVASYVSRFGIALKQKPRGRPRRITIDPRADAMKALYSDGSTLEQIGTVYGITRERVRQIMTGSFGTRAKDGGKSESARKARKEFNRKRDARSMKAWGCVYREYRRILGHPGKPTYAYWAQRKNAHARDIDWELNLWQWWKIWEQSGRWSERGRGKGYCMCRLNDAGPYAVDNVYIATGTDNMKDHWVNKRAAESMEAA